MAYNAMGLFGEFTEVPYPDSCEIALSIIGLGIGGYLKSLYREE